ncbi:MAG: hypothetical protein AB8H79_21875 [Myxococcota bacterium]
MLSRLCVLLVAAVIVLGLGVCPTAHAYEPPPFSSSNDLHLSPEETPFRRVATDEALAEVQLPIYAVVAQRTDDSPRGEWANSTEAAIERTWAAWMVDPAFDPAEAVLVLVDMGGRKTLIKTGSTWDAEFGLHNEELTRITERAFVPLAKAGNLDGALARTLSDIDTIFRSYRDMAPAEPVIDDQPLAMAPESPLLPRVKNGLKSLRITSSQSPFPIRVRVAQHLPRRSDPKALTQALLPDPQTGIAVLWDVRSKTVHTALGSSFDELGGAGVQFVETLNANSTDGEGHITSSNLSAGLLRALTALREVWLDTHFTRRKAWQFDPENSWPLRTSPANLSTALPQTRATLAELDVPVRIAVVDQADREGDAIAPTGKPWMRYVHSEHMSMLEDVPPPDQIVVTVIGEPRAVWMSGHNRLAPMLPLNKSVFSDGEPSAELPLDLYVASVLSDVATYVEKAEMKRQADLAHAAATAAAKKRTEQAIIFGGSGAGALGVTGIGIFAIMTFRSRRKKHFLVAYDDLHGKVVAARDRLDDLRMDQELKAQVRLLRDRGALTTALFDRTTAYLDEAEVGVRSLERRLAELENDAERARRGLDPWDWDQLMPKLEAPVWLEPEPDMQAELFAPLPEPREVHLHRFMSELNADFKQARAGMGRLTDAARALLRRIEDDINPRPLEELKTRLPENNTPEAWLALHPLHNGEEALQSLEGLRRVDPVAYLDTLEAFNARCVTVEADLDVMLDAIETRHEVREVGLEALRQPPLDTHTPEDSHPDGAHRYAKELDAVADAAIAKAEDPAVTIDAVQLAIAGWEDVSARVQAVHAAVQGGAATVQDAKEGLKRAEAAMQRHRSTVAQMASTHARLDRISDVFEDAATDLSEGRAALTLAEQNLAAKRHLEAVRQATIVEREVTESAEDVAILMELIEQQRSLAARVRSDFATIRDLRTSYLATATSYGTHGVGMLSEGDEALETLLESTTLQGRVDWAQTAAKLKAVRTAWGAGVASAKQSYDHERAVLAQAAARRARRQSAWSNSYSSSSSSSSSSWGSSSSGGSSYSSSSRSGGSSYSSGSSSRSGGSSW